MSEKKLKIVFLALVFVCAVLMMTGCGSGRDLRQDSGDRSAETQAEVTVEMSGEELQTAAEEGYLAPDLELHYLDGSSAALSDYRGKVILLNLWATWCGPCVNEMPAFPRLQEKFGDQLQIIALNCGEAAETVEAFAEEKGYTFPIAVDEEYTAMLGAYQTSSIPYTVIIDSAGVIRHISVGAGDADTMFESYGEAIEEVMKAEENE